jgi:hypothetical protein
MKADEQKLHYLSSLFHFATKVIMIFARIIRLLRNIQVVLAAKWNANI